MNTTEQIEQALGIKLQLIPNGHRQERIIVGEPLTEDKLKQLVADGKCEWQDAKACDCGLGDGLHYVYIAGSEELDTCELFIGIDLKEAYLTFC